MEYHLLLEDPETQKTYELLLSKEDHIRAQNDDQFVNALLTHARQNSEKELSEQEEEQPGPSSCNKKITVWSYEQSKSLILSMSTHYNDLGHPVRRKYVYENIVNDLLSAGFEVDIISCQNKWKSLTRSYSKAKDTKNRTGQGPSRFQFFDLMDDLLGQKPTNTCTHAIGTLQVDNDSVDTDETGEDTEQSQDTMVNEDQIPDEDKENKNVKKPKLLKQDYIKIKAQEYAKRAKRHAEKMDIEKQKIELESKRLKLLEEYLKKK